MRVPRSAFLILSIVSCAAFGASASYAGPNANSKIVLHLGTPLVAGGCTAAQARPACSGVNTSGALYPATYFAYVLVMDADASAGVQGVQFGIDYDPVIGSGVDVYGWTNCATLQFPQTGWPASGTGNLVTWNSCQQNEPAGAGTGVVAVVGYFYVGSYSPDVLKLTARPVDGLAVVADCGFSGVYIEDVLSSTGGPGVSALGEVAFSSTGAPGYNPCGLQIGVDCTIEGPPVVESSTTNTYTVPGAPSGATVSWSVTGAGLLTSSSGASADILASDLAGTFHITVDVLYLGETYTCEKDVDVSYTPPPPTGCFIQGPTTILAGGQAVYHVNELTGGTIQWSVSGDGVIVGPDDQWSATFQSTGAGSFTAQAAVTRTDVTKACSLDVNAVDCTLDGPTSVYPSTVVAYEALDAPGVTYDWSVGGGASIVGSSGGHAINVSTGPVGSFTVHLTATSAFDTTTCERNVQVSATSVTPNSNAKMMVHVGGPTARNQCARALIACNSVVSNGGLYPPNTYFAYLLIEDGDATSGIGGVSFGIQYDGTPHQGVDLYEWHLCGSTEEPSAGWPAPGGGNLIRWAACQRTEPGGAGTGAAAVAGYFYMGAYSPDYLAVTPPPSGDFVVYSCNGQAVAIPESAPSRFGRAGFGNNVYGYVPCGFVVPVRTTTWGAIKALYKE